jgi:hypothetical protein
MLKKTTNYLKERFSEPSSIAGLAAVSLGLGQVFDINEAPVVADAINTAATSGNWQTAAVTIVLGILAIFLKEKKS